MKFIVTALVLSLVGTSVADTERLSRRRFGQQNPPVEGKIGQLQALKNGLAGTLSGQVPSTLLGAADPCAKLQLADTIVQAAPGDAATLAAARELVNAEQNFNPANNGKPKFCGNANLPATKELRGILPKISEADNLQGAAAFNQISSKSLADALAGNVKNVDGKSVADQIVEAGFTDFAGAPAAGNNNNGNQNNQNKNNNNQNNQNKNNQTNNENNQNKNNNNQNNQNKNNNNNNNQNNRNNNNVVTVTQTVTRTVVVCPTNAAGNNNNNQNNGNNNNNNNQHNNNNNNNQHNNNNNNNNQHNNNNNNNNNNNQNNQNQNNQNNQNKNNQTNNENNQNKNNNNNNNQNNQNKNNQNNNGNNGNVIFQPKSVEGLNFDPLVLSNDPNRRFQVAADTFVGSGAACSRVGDRLFNSCANKLNSEGRGNELGTICAPARDAAKTDCAAAAANV
ncbi:hypothetical protein SpCBS45565_g06376 [Spizellomyces sp. 'palustris']|nr:hypothetical protein SpCBS45565_g06376 [Spizellomyces sp. 'palustris']